MELSFDRAENRYVVIENIFNDEKYMHSTYVRLTEVLSEVIRKADQERKRLAALQDGDCRTQSGARRRASLSTALYEYGNNVISISGRRGQGKTSAMLSLTNALVPGNDNNYEQASLFEGHSFLVLDPIDPTVLEDHTSALMLVLSRMYRKVEEAWERYLRPGGYGTGWQGVSDSRRNEIVDMFQKCFAGIRAVKLGEEPKSLASLHSLSDSSQLKVNLYNMVEMLLDFCICGTANNRLLVIQLDDTDFQIGKGYEVLDDMRKYLTLPNVIILMATDMDLMYKVVAQHFFREMEQGVEYGVVDRVEIENNAHKFLDKLVPPEQIVYLPSLYQTMSRPDDTVRLRLTNGKDLIIPKEGEELIPLEDMVLRYLYRKTGILCVSKEGENHGFIPTTLRGLMQLLDLLTSLKDIPLVDDARKKDGSELADELGKRLTVKEHNLGVFEDYLLSTWVNAKFSTAKWMLSASEVRHLMKRIADDSGLDDVCRRIIRTLNAYGHLRNSEVDGRRHTHAVDDVQTEHGRLFQAVSNAVKDAAGQLDSRFVAVVYLSVALRWHKAVIRQMKMELPALRESESTYAFRLSPEKTGLPKSFWLREMEGRGDDFQRSLRSKLISGPQKGIHSRLNEILVPNNEFRVLHIVQVLLSMAETVDGSPLISYGDFSQESVYDAQEAMLVIACNPELQRELIQAEEERLVNTSSAPEDQKAMVSSIIGCLNRREVELNMGHLTLCEDSAERDEGRIPLGQTVLCEDPQLGRTVEQRTLIPADFRFDLVSRWINPIEDATETSLASWFVSLQSFIDGGPKRLTDIYTIAIMLCEVDEAGARSALQSLLEEHVANFTQFVRSITIVGGKEINESLAALSNLCNSLDDEGKDKEEKVSVLNTCVDDICKVLSYDANAIKSLA